MTVNVVNMTEAAVEELHLTITADGTVSNNRAVTQPNIVLTRTSSGVTTPAGKPAQWKFLATDIPVGTYDLQAYAFDVQNAIIGTTPATFSSVVVNVSVTSGNTTVANIFLRQDVKDPDFNTPYITSVVFDRQPAFYETTKITVTGAQGAVGNLNLHAQGVGLFDTVASPAPSWAAGTGNARTGATIDWEPKDPTTPGTAENQIVTVRLTDSAGNDTSLKMTINVDHERGEIDFNITFNEAPSIDVRTSIVNDATANVVTMTASYTDPEYPADDVTYTWDVSDCEGANVTIVPNPTTSEITGVVAGNGTATHTVTLTIAPGEDVPAVPPTCAVEIKVEDQGISDGGGGWVANSASSRTKTIHITVGNVTPTVTP